MAESPVTSSTPAEELKACPFCGSTNVVRRGSRAIYEPDRVYCIGCHVVASVDVWNRRPKAEEGWRDIESELQRRRTPPAAEKGDEERVSEWMDTLDPMTREYIWDHRTEISRSLAALLTAVRAEENEACARIADRKHGVSRAQYEDRTDDNTFVNPYYEGAADAADEIASAIRHRHTGG
jgi:hypothetical protein